MAIPLQDKANLTPVSFKLPPAMKTALQQIADKEDQPVSTIVRSLLEYGIQHYKSGGLNKGAEEPSQDVGIGDSVIAGGLMGRIQDFNDRFAVVEVAKGVHVKIERAAITERLAAKEKLPKLKI